MNKIKELIKSKETDWALVAFNFAFTIIMMLLNHFRILTFWNISIYSFIGIIFLNLLIEYFKERWQREDETTDETTNESKDKATKVLVSQAAQFIRLTALVGMFIAAITIMSSDKPDSQQSINPINIIIITIGN